MNNPDVTCACWTTEARCDECRASLFAQLRGVAYSRARTWVAELRSVRGSWPVGSAAVLAVAKLRVGDLTRDAKLLEMLAAVCAEEAGRMWGTSDRIDVRAR